MMQLPPDFVQTTRLLMGDERFEHFLKALDEPSPVSIRVNPLRTENLELRTERYDYFHAPKTHESTSAESNHNSQFNRVPWCPTGYYLSDRPNFTFDPLFHAGCYYVQEASSMFIDCVLRQYVKEPVAMLDLCAAPGGKSTAARAVLPEGSLLVSNEPVRQRASILLENITKWGYPDCVVTNNYPKDFRKAKALFDVILCDVPCSGEGMFRKDPGAISEWSLQNVEHCWRLQREIVAEAWQCLKEGGLFIYSTCTYNIKENEENIRWMMEELDAEVLPVETKEEWGITGSLLEGFTEPVWRFIPGFTKGEGLFMAVMRKRGETGKSMFNSRCLKSLNVLMSPLAETTAVAEADVDYATAIAFLRGEALQLPDMPRGIVQVTFMGQPLGFVKNIGNRANNLYPKEWRIKSTHIPKEYETIFRLA